MPSDFPLLPLLNNYLSVMPAEIRDRQQHLFYGIPANFEFATFVPPEEINRHSDTALRKGFTVWANVDETSAFLYGACLIAEEETGEMIHWLTRITAPGQKGQALMQYPGRPDQLIIFKSRN